MEVAVKQRRLIGYLTSDLIFGWIYCWFDCHYNNGVTVKELKGLIFRIFVSGVNISIK